MLDRIESLERRCRWLLAGLALSFAPWLFGATVGQPNEIQTKRIRILDADGKPAVVIGAEGLFIDNKDGDSMSILADGLAVENKGKRVCMVRAEEVNLVDAFKKSMLAEITDRENVGAVILNNSSDKTAVSMKGGDDPGVLVNGKDGKCVIGQTSLLMGVAGNKAPVAGISVDGDAGVVQLDDAKNKTSVSIHAGDGGGLNVVSNAGQCSVRPTFLTLLQGGGKQPIASIGVHDGVGMCRLGDANGKTSVSIKGGDGGGLFVKDKTGQCFVVAGAVESRGADGDMNSMAAIGVHNGVGQCLVTDANKTTIGLLTGGDGGGLNVVGKRDTGVVTSTGIQIQTTQDRKPLVGLSDNEGAGMLQLNDGKQTGDGISLDARESVFRWNNDSEGVFRKRK